MPERRDLRGVGATVPTILEALLNLTIHSALSHYPEGMSFRCLFRAHSPMLTSIVRREGRYTALCDDCGLPIERTEGGRWAAAAPLVARGDQAATTSRTKVH